MKIGEEDGLEIRKLRRTVPHCASVPDHQDGSGGSGSAQQARP